MTVFFFLAKISLYTFITLVYTVFSCLFKRQVFLICARKAYGVLEVQLNLFLNSGLEESAGPRGPRGLMRRSAAARLLRLWVRIPPASWTFVVSVVCCQVEVSVPS